MTLTRISVAIALPLLVAAPCLIADNAPAKSASQPADASEKTGFVYDEACLLHNTGLLHPERPARLIAIMDELRKSGFLDTLIRIPAIPAPLEWLTTIHTTQYIARVRAACGKGVEFIDTRDVPVSSNSFQAALLAAGGPLAAIDAVMEGKVRNAFCAVRPPGHHALREKAMGFCIFNNVAIAARYVQQKHKLARVLIIDWDVHHGNGTETAFQSDPSILYFSVHQHPFYPHSGDKTFRHQGKNAGGHINVPLPAGSGRDQYLNACREILLPQAIEFQPDFILISAGFDAHKDDPLGSMTLEADDYADMARIVFEIAGKCCNGRIVAVLEGGYDLQGLAQSVAAVISVLQKE